MPNYEVTLYGYFEFTGNFQGEDSDEARERAENFLLMISKTVPDVSFNVDGFQVEEVSGGGG